MRGRWLAVGAAALALVLGSPARPTGAQAPSADLGVSGFSFTADAVQPALARGRATVRNAGPAEVTDASLVLTLPAGVGYVDAGVGARPVCSFDAAARTVSCAVGALGAGVETEAVLTVANAGLAAGATATVEARVTSSVTDPEPSNNAAAASWSFTVGPQPTVPGGGPSADLVLGPAQLQLVGTQLTLWFDAVNAGPSRAEGVVFRFTLPAGTTYLSATLATAPCSFDPATRSGTCSIDGLDAGVSTGAFVAVDVSGVPAGQRLLFTVELASATADPVPANNQQRVAYQVAGTVVTASAPLPGTGPATTSVAVVLGAGALGAGLVLLVLSVLGSGRPGPGRPATPR